MNVRLELGTFLAAVVLTSCGSVENNAWTNGIARSDAYAIRDLVLTAHPGCRIDGYSPDPNRPGHIYCYTSCGIYLLYKTPHGWKLVPGERVIVV